MPKPVYRYVCPCGFRTQRPWRWKSHLGRKERDRCIALLLERGLSMTLAAHRKREKDAPAGSPRP